MAYETDNERQERTPDITRPGEGPIDREELQTLVSRVITDAVNFAEDELSAGREKATKYYFGEKFGNEEEGRSQLVLTEVRDAIRAVEPQMMRVFFGPDDILDVEPQNAEDIPAAEQACDYLKHVWQKDNPGFRLARDVIRDGLLRKIGAFKWGWEESTQVKVERLENVSEEELQMLAEDDDVELTSLALVESYIDYSKANAAPADPMNPQAGPAPIQLFDVELKRTQRDGRVRIYAIPSEELVFSPEARSPEDALFIGHQTDKTRGELLALGIDEELLEELAGPDDSDLRDAPERIASRDGALGAVSERDPDAGEANEKIRYVEGYMRIDVDGDGINELRKVCTVGTQYKIAKIEPCDHVQISTWCPDPEAHSMGGLSLADDTMDLQLAKSMMARSGLDGLALSIYPRQEYVEGMVNVADLMNTEIGSLIRTRAPGMLREVKHTFDAPSVLSMMEWIDGVKEARVGVDKNSAGIDADALQSSTKAAVGATVTASQLRTSLLCHLFAEGALKPMFKGILRLLVKHQPRKRIVRLRGQFVEVDPRSWNADMDVTINVGLGVGFTEQKLQTLAQVAETQMNILGSMGMNQPVTTPAQLSKTLRTALALEGFKNGTDFFNDVPPDWQPPAPDPSQGSPEMALVQLEREKAQHAAQMKQQELQLKMQQAQLEQQRADFELQQKFDVERMKLEFEREKLAQEYALRLEEMRLKYSAETAQHAVEQTMQDAREKEKTAADAALRHRELDMQHQRELFEIEKTAETERQAATDTESE